METIVRDKRRLCVACLALLLAAGSASAAGAADVAVEAVIVEPASPGPSAICGLKVRLKNGGTQPIANFRFSVKVDGQDVAVYKTHSYAVNIEARTADELALYSFYSPAAAKAFDVQVTLVEAEWLQIKRDGTTTTTTPTGPVAGLPVSGSVSVKMSGGK